MENLQENRKIEIEQETLNDLNTTRKWSMFMAILGFIFLGLMLIVGLLAGTFLSALSPGGGMKVGGVFSFIMFLIIAVIYFFPVLYLFRFSRHTGNAVASLDKAELHKAFRNLKSYFVYIGILIIIILSLYLISLIFLGSSLSRLRGLS
jgi:amino acid transporter